jgi:hypothetical protein
VMKSECEALKEMSRKDPERKRERNKHGQPRAMRFE